jgi:hypothetical protein
LDLRRRFCFHLLADQSQPQGQVHEGSERRDQFLSGRGVYLKVINEGPYQRSGETILSNPYESGPQLRLMLAIVQSSSPPIFLDLPLENRFLLGQFSEHT